MVTETNMLPYWTKSTLHDLDFQKLIAKILTWNQDFWSWNVKLERFDRFILLESFLVMLTYLMLVSRIKKPDDVIMHSIKPKSKVSLNLNALDRENVNWTLKIKFLLLKTEQMSVQTHTLSSTFKFSVCILMMKWINEILSTCVSQHSY